MDQQSSGSGINLASQPVHAAPLKLLDSELPVSVILPVYNGMKFLEACIGSVLAQDFTGFEFLIIDDCSGDGSWEWLQQLTDPRVQLYRNEKNRGLFFNLNFLVKKSRGSIIKIWSQDDVMYPNCIGVVVNFHQQHPGIGFSYSARDYIDEAGQKIPADHTDDTPDIVSTALHARIAFFTGSIAGNIANVAINKTALEKVGLFNEQMKISGDFEMWVRLAQYYPTGFIRQPLIQLRNHKGQLSGQEKYFIYHLREDIEAYHILLGYVNEGQREEGRLLMRSNKLMFYYTLMVKALLKGRFKTAWKFHNNLQRLDNVFILTGYFIKNRLLSKKRPYISKEPGI